MIIFDRKMVKYIMGGIEATWTFSYTRRKRKTTQHIDVKIHG